MEIRQLEILPRDDGILKRHQSGRTGFSHPGAVSLQLQNLAAELHVELFVRTGNRLVPTEAAFRLARKAESVIHQVREIRQEFDNDPQQDTRPFYFATGATALIHRLGHPLRLLRKNYPQTSIQVNVAVTEEIVAGLLSRRYDLGLISLPVTDERIKIIPLFEEELRLLRPWPGSRRAKSAAQLKPSELEDVPFLLYPKSSNMRSIIDAFFKEAGLSPRVVMEADDTEAIKRLVESGFGYSILPERALRRQSKFFQTFCIAGHRLIRKQALAMAETEYPRALTVSIANFLKTALTPK